MKIFNIKYSYRNKLMLQLVLMVVVILSITNIFDIYISRNNLIEEYVATERKTIAKVEQSIQLLDLSYEIIDANMNYKMEEISNNLIEEYKQLNGDISNGDLEHLSSNYGVSDIYLIDREGTLVKSTVEENLGLNLIEAIGGEFKYFLKQVREDGKFVTEKMSLEVGTNRLKKFSYQPIANSDYILEIAWYAEDFNDIIKDSNFKSIIKDIQKGEIIDKVRIFDKADLRSLGEVDYNLPKGHRDMINNKLESDSKLVIEEENQNGVLKKYTYNMIKLASINNDVILQVVSNKNIIKDKLKRQLYFDLTIIFLGILLAIFVSSLVSGRIIGNINNLKDKMKKLSEGNLEIRIEKQSEDEFGDLADSFNNTIINLSELIKELIEVIDFLSSNSEELASSAEESNATIQDVVETINSMSSRLEGLYNNFATVSSASEEVSAISDEGRETINEVIVETDVIKEKVESSNKKIDLLHKRLEEIENVVELMKEITEQTNLLSLNASIEAARAGESGRGFDVVANEIRNLSEDASQSTAKISKLIEDIKLTSDQAIESSKDANQAVNKGKEIIDQAGELFEQINQAITDTNNDFQNVNISMKKLNDENSEIKVITKDIIQAIDEITESAEELSEVANKVKNLVHEFEVD
ncbi:methyl-accepting chemotaxis protein [Orenia marismortui]|uniref:methyl-accepting chemotaxis protein n=1 Tax=Orenia marismortui TaxID=46469 RepID=UPI000366B94B|nr:methyl-accepting chemotaxis protein [Orenia marismortui]